MLPPGAGPDSSWETCPTEELEVAEPGRLAMERLCNNGDEPLNWIQLPVTDHPVIPQNIYRMSGGSYNESALNN